MARWMPAVVGASWLMAAPLQAHHAISTFYDTSRRVTIEAIVRELHFVNPHPFVLSDVRSRDGASEQWRLEMDNQRELVEIGFTQRTLRPGDTIVVCKLDRLARSSRDLHNILHEVHEQDCGFVSLAAAWCDTTTEVGRLMLTIMGGIAQFERELIRSRCDEGIERAKALGTKFGRKAVLDASERRVVAERYAKGETMAALAQAYECGEATIWRALQAA